MTRLDLTSPSNRRLLQQHAPKPPFVPRLAQRALNQYLGGYIREGGFSLIYPDGEQYYYGQSRASQPGPTLHFTSWDDITTLAANPSLGFGLAYSNGRIIHDDESDLTGFLKAMFANRRDSKAGSMLAQLRRRPLNHQARQTRNIAAHYDQATEQWWFDRVLGPTESYTCARFTSGNESLDEAQTAKMLNVAAKLDLTDERDRPLDQRSQILEVGSGWGYMACLLAQRFGVKVTGVTIAAGQVKASIERAKAMGVTQLVGFRLVGYQRLPELLANGTIGQFDAAYSIGMLEHVPHSEYQEYFRILAMITKPGASVFIHCITNRLGGAPDAFVSRVVFSGQSAGQRCPDQPSGGAGWTGRMGLREPKVPLRTNAPDVDRQPRRGQG